MIKNCKGFNKEGNQISLKTGKFKIGKNMPVKIMVAMEVSSSTSCGKRLFVPKCYQIKFMYKTRKVIPKVYANK